MPVSLIMPESPVCVRRWSYHVWRAASVSASPCLCRWHRHRGFSSYCRCKPQMVGAPLTAPEIREYSRLGKYRFERVLREWVVTIRTDDKILLVEYIHSRFQEDLL